MVNQSVACARLRSSGFNSTETNDILNTVHRWIECSGTEWTVKRLKSLKAQFIQQLTTPLQRGERDWVSYRGRHPRGAFRPIFKLIEGRHNVRKIQKALNALMIYSSYKLHVASPSQTKKFYNSMEKKEPEDKIYINGLNRPNDIKISKHRTQSSITVRPGKRSPFWTSIRRPNVTMCDLKIVSRDRTIEETLESFGHPDLYRWACSIDGIDEYLGNECYQALISARYEEDFPRHEHGMGLISFIQEPGHKLRAVANPFSSFQIILDPMFRRLKKFSSTLIEDCTMDQHKGILRVQQLVSKEVCSSIDLSDATNTIPFSYQLVMLKNMNIDPHMIDLFELVSKGQYFCPDGQYRTFSCGQPLGAKPSFGSFSLFHHIMVREAIDCTDGTNDATRDFWVSISGGVPTTQYPYQILGDDIVIASRYEKELSTLYSELELSISYQKSISKSTWAEFASRLITADSIITMPKWKIGNDNSFLDLVRVQGKQAIGLLRPRQRRIFNLLKEIPESMGGLGLNPHGKTWRQRVRENLETCHALRNEQVHLLVSNGAKALYKLKVALVMASKSHEALNDPFASLDYMINENSLDRSRPDSSDIGRLLDDFGITKISSSADVSGFSQDNTDQTSDPRGRSTLEVLERKLKNRPR